jgi:hypothetical protein
MATLYAQSTGNWDAINWNTAANGSGTNETPGASDTLVSNSYTVTVNGTYTVTKVTNTGGGTFTLADESHLTCTDSAAGVVGDASNAGAVTFALTGVGEEATLTAIVVGGDGSNEWGVSFTGTAQLTINGAVVGGTFAGAEATGADGVRQTGAGTLIVTVPSGVAVSGSNNGGTTNYARGIYSVNVASTITITGNVQGGQVGSSNYTNIGLHATGAATITVTGNVLGGVGSNSNGIYLTGASTCTVTGNVTGGTSTGAHGINTTAAATINVTGDVTANVGAGVYSNNASVVIIIDGTCTASSGYNAVHIYTSITGGTLLVTGPLRAAASGKQAVCAPNWYWKAGTVGALEMDVYQFDDPLTLRTLYSAEALPGMPDEADVKSGVIYGPSDELTGTYAATVTPATADIADAVWNRLVADLDTADSIGARLAQAATVDSTGAQMAALGV